MVTPRRAARSRPAYLKPATPSSLDVPPEIERKLLTVEWIPVDQLNVDHKYQRELDSARVNKMAREWNWNACGHLAVSLREGTQRHSATRRHNAYNVLDGQQRLGSIKILGFKEAPCRVYIDLTDKEEAELFELLNNAKKPTFNDLFKSRVVRGEDMAGAINAAVTSVGWYLDPERKHKTARHIQSMQELVKMFDLGKSALIMDTLRFIAEIWPNELLGHQAMILAGVSRFLHHYGRDVEIKQMKEKMIRLGQTKMVQQAWQYAAARGGVSSKGLVFQEAMLMVYNQNRKEENRVKSKFS